MNQMPKDPYVCPRLSMLERARRDLDDCVDGVLGFVGAIVALGLVGLLIVAAGASVAMMFATAPLWVLVIILFLAFRR